MGGWMPRAAGLLVCVCLLPSSFAAEEEGAASSPSSCGRTWSSPRHATIDQGVFLVTL